MGGEESPAESSPEPTVNNFVRRAGRAGFGMARCVHFGLFL
jgi:hypothetical protein